jgi:hypothetical protein
MKSYFVKREGQIGWEEEVEAENARDAAKQFFLSKGVPKDEPIIVEEIKLFGFREKAHLNTSNCRSGRHMVGAG